MSFHRAFYSSFSSLIIMRIIHEHIVLIFMLQRQHVSVMEKILQSVDDRMGRGVAFCPVL